MSASTCVQTKVIIIINSRAWKKRGGGGEGGRRGVVGLFCHSEMTLSSHLALIYLTTSTCVKTFPSFINLTFKCILFHPCNICGEAFQRERADIPHYAPPPPSEHLVLFSARNSAPCSFGAKRFDAATLSVLSSEFYELLHAIL